MGELEGGEGGVRWGGGEVGGEEGGVRWRGGKGRVR